MINLWKQRSGKGRRKSWDPSRTQKLSLFDSLFPFLLFACNLPLIRYPFKHHILKLFRAW